MCIFLIKENIFEEHNLIEGIRSLVFSIDVSTDPPRAKEFKKGESEKTAIGEVMSGYTFRKGGNKRRGSVRSDWIRQ